MGTRRPLPRQGWADHNLQNGCVSPHPSLRGCFCLNGVSVGLGSLSSQGIWFFRMHFFAGQLTGAFSPSVVFSDLPRRAQTLFLSCRAQGGFLRMPGEKVLGLVATDMSHVLIAHFFFLANCLQESGAEKPPGRAAGQPATSAQLCHPPAFHHCEHQQEDCHRLQHF